MIRLLLAFSAVTISCGRESTPPREGTTAPARSAVRDKAQGRSGTAPADDGMWPMPARTHAATRYSYQTETTRTNVSNLRPAWSFSTGVLRGHEAAPLVVGSTMHVVTPFPNILYAIDLNPPAGRLKRKYEPPTARASQGVACCDVVNRGAAFAPLPGSCRLNSASTMVQVSLLCVHSDRDGGRRRGRALRSGRQ